VSDAIATARSRLNQLPTAKQEWLMLGLLWLVGAVGDRIWFAHDRSVPAWDQADYLAGVLNYWQAFQSPQWFAADWWTGVWQLSSKIPPLVYIATTPFLTVFGAGPDQSTLVHLLFSAILLGSVYAIASTLFMPAVGLWAAGFCLLMPGLYRLRLEFLLDYPLAAMVTLCFACLTLWRWEVHAWNAVSSPSQRHLSLRSWLLAGAIGLTLGLALMVKQSALLFLVVPLVWVTVASLWQRAGWRLAQIGLAIGLTVLVCFPWYSTNWLTILTAGRRATVDSAIAEGDPAFWSLANWTFYLRQLPGMVSLPLLLVPLLGFLLFWRRSRVSSHWAGEVDSAPKTRAYRQEVFALSRRSLIWLVGFWLGAYLLSSLNPNKDIRYTVPYLPVLAVILAYGLTLLPSRWYLLRWGMVAVSALLMITNLLPTPQFDLAASRSSLARHPAYIGPAFPQAEIAATVVQAAPYLRSTIGVLPSTPEINQHNVNYYGLLQNAQVYGRQVGTQLAQVEQDGRSFAWFLTKTGQQGSIRKPEAQSAMARWVKQSSDFRLAQAWSLPNGDRLKLYQQRVPALEVLPLWGELERQNPEVNQHSPVRLEQAIVPDLAPAGQPIPVTYKWSGPWDLLQSGLVILTWRRLGEPAVPGVTRWTHDHGIGMGALRATVPATRRTFRFLAIERSAMLPPADLIPGEYTLEATYLNRQTGETFAIATPAISLKIDPAAPPTPAPELDLITQLRLLAASLPQGTQAIDRVFAEVARIGQSDPVQDYVNQARQAMEYRLQQDPQNLPFAYTLALATVLKRQVEPAIAALQRVVQLDPQNPYAHAYLAFVNLYAFRPQAAQVALTQAQTLNPNLVELKALNSIAALMQGNLMQAWQNAQAYQQAKAQR
jgi:4-amino-4-deoxy-L-arabinose transferase-like glycosyltransferase